MFTILFRGFLKVVYKIVFLWSAWYSLVMATKFLTAGRTHQTKVGTSFYDIAALISAVVQGNGIGPLLFLTWRLSFKAMALKSNYLRMILSSIYRLLMTQMLHRCSKQSML